VTACSNCHGDSCLNSTQPSAVYADSGLDGHPHDQEGTDELNVYFYLDDCEHEEVVGFEEE